MDLGLPGSALGRYSKHWTALSIPSPPNLWRQQMTTYNDIVMQYADHLADPETEHGEGESCQRCAVMLSLIEHGLTLR